MEKTDLLLSVSVLCESPRLSARVGGGDIVTGEFERSTVALVVVVEAEQELARVDERLRWIEGVLA